jgi:hypothetical protein
MRRRPVRKFQSVLLPVTVFLVSLCAGTVYAASPGDVLKEGYGLPQVHLGMAIDEVTRVLGEPDQNLYGFVFVHKRPDGTQLSYRIEDNRLVSINLKGNSGSVYVTARGAEFGMSRRRIVRLYGEPEAEALNKLFYHSQGVSFFFNDDDLYEISVFPPKTVPRR